MKHILTFFLLINWLAPTLQAQTLHPIPRQSIDFRDYLNSQFAIEKVDTLEEFRISDFITYQEYKIYLDAIAKDSSAAFLLSQQPDSGIAPSPELYQQYVHSKLYDKEPVVGISWDAAMEYCKWKTIKENPTDSIAFVYRLPSCKEWIAAYHFFNKNKLPHDMNQLFADWLLEAYYMNWSSFFEENSAIVFFYKVNDLRAWKRKLTIGNSYVYAEPSLLFYQFWYFADTGHRHLGFRILKEAVGTDKTSINHQILDSWNLAH